MSNINLFKSVEEKEKETSSVKMKKGGFLLPFSFLLLVLLVYVGLLAYSKVVRKGAEGVQEQISAETKSLSEKDINRVADFKERLDDIIKENKVKSYPNDFFDQFQALVIQGAQADSIDYLSDSATVDIACDNFSTVAKQILSFKGSEFFSDTKVGSITRDQDGKVVLSLILTFKK